MALAFRTALSACEYTGCTLFDNGSFLLITGSGHPLGNFAMPQGVAQTEDCAQKLVDAGYISALLFPGSLNPEAEAGLDRYGFASVGELPAMAVGIEQITEVPVPTGYTFRRLTTADDNTGWAPAFAKGYDLPLELAELFSPVHALTSDEPGAPLQFFEVRSGDQIVGVSMMLLGEGVAGIYCVATHPDHRGKGIGALVTAEPLRQAGKLGYQTGILQSSEMGYPIYKRLGFEDVGSIRMYLRNPA